MAGCLSPSLDIEAIEIFWLFTDAFVAFSNGESLPAGVDNSGC